MYTEVVVLVGVGILLLYLVIKKDSIAYRYNPFIPGAIKNRKVRIFMLVLAIAVSIIKLVAVVVGE